MPHFRLFYDMTNPYAQETLNTLPTDELRVVYTSAKRILQKRLDCNDKEELRDFINLVAMSTRIPVSYMNLQAHLKSPASVREQKAYKKFIALHFAKVKHFTQEIHSLTADVFAQYIRENYDELKTRKPPIHSTPLGYAKLLAEIDDIYGLILPDYVANGMLPALLNRSEIKRFNK